MQVPTAHVPAGEVHVTTVFGSTTHLYGKARVLQVSVPLQRLPSSSPAQSAVVAHWHVFAPGTHLPPPQASPTVQPFPSLQLALVFTCEQPPVGSQLSVVQALLSSQLSTEPGLVLQP